MFSDPVVGDRFFGRGEALRLLAKRVSALKDGYRQNIAIVGPNLIGKSSLILHFFSNFSYPKIIALYIDLRPNSFSHFIHKFLGALLYHYLKNQNIDSDADLDSLKTKAQGYIPKTVEAICAIEGNIKTSDFNKAYENLLSLTAKLKQESGTSCIIILDEFHLLDSFKIKLPFANLAKEIITQKDTMYILISSQISYAKRILANELSLLFGNFETVRLECFDLNTCCNFLEKRFQDINLPRTLRDFLIAFSEGHPFYLDIISNELKEKAKELNRAEVSRRLIAEALCSLIYDSKGILNQYFTSILSYNLNGADYSNFIPILLSASSRGCRFSDISKAANRKPKLISRQLNHLLDKDLFSKVGVFYRIQDKIFRFWLKSVYQTKSFCLTADLPAQSKQFIKEVEGEIFDFTQKEKQGFGERVIELFRSFRNETVVIQNKTFKLPHFEQLQPLALAGLDDCIIARYKDGCWVCLVKKDPIDEAQIQKFAQACRRANYKIRKAVIVACCELDLNVKLLALEKKIWIWPISDLNLIFDLYGKPPISR